MNYLGESNVIKRVLIGGRHEGHREIDVIMEAQVGEMPSLKRRHQTRNKAASRSWEKQKKGFSSRDSKRNAALTTS